MRTARKPKESALDKMLKHHPKHCQFWVFSGDRHCSCGRDEAIVELQKLRELVAQMQLPMFAQIVDQS